MTYAAIVVVACVFTEFVGYWLHILLHSHRIAFLSRNHADGLRASLQRYSFINEGSR